MFASHCWRGVRCPSLGPAVLTALFGILPRLEPLCFPQRAAAFFLADTFRNVQRKSSLEVREDTQRFMAAGMLSAFGTSEDGDVAPLSFSQGSAAYACHEPLLRRVLLVAFFPSYALCDSHYVHSNSRRIRRTFRYRLLPRSNYRSIRLIGFVVVATIACCFR
jgi:hypothetical protein